MRSPRPDIGSRFGAEHCVHSILFEKIKHCECVLIAPCSEHNGKETFQLPDSSEVAQNGGQIKWDMRSVQDYRYRLTIPGPNLESTLANRTSCPAGWCFSNVNMTFHLSSRTIDR